MGENVALRGTLSALLALALLAGLAAHGAQSPGPDDLPFARSDQTWIGRQPSAAELGELRALGIRSIVSVRTLREQDDRAIVPYDEAATVEANGMTWVNLPLGGESNPPSPELIDRFAATMDATKGELLLHCASGLRAANVWVAYLVRERGLTPDEAVGHGKVIHPDATLVDGLLGTVPSRD
jgi:protein tyrosine phosphatase (PTP) superfamily phosphohydrolase (DUF442 family)